jgi:hypothetical protein
MSAPCRRTRSALMQGDSTMAKKAKKKGKKKAKKKGKR